ncbi:MAG: NAD+ synthase [Candidatus Cloacimonetes bacterium HGW-Cloacimonetes-3]|jgi:NAD+ synthase|nr:MAG: NAD+ synthase [Candidatus Cloacimonetes bacterium HGW-Cloacimonetes-3]
MLNIPQEIDRICVFIQDYCDKSGFKHLVIGLSGGIDSALSAALAVKAVGISNVHSFNLPYRNSHPDSALDAALVARHLGLDLTTIDLSHFTDTYFDAYEPDATALRRGNWIARIRMNILFDQAAKLNALVMGTGNLTELMVGYCTQYGDSACAFEPIGHLYKTEVWEMAKVMELPEKLISKTPTADLWEGQSDEAELGISYPDLDAILQAILQGSSTEDFAAGALSKVKNLIMHSAFKRVMPPAPERV